MSQSIPSKSLFVSKGRIFSVGMMVGLRASDPCNQAPPIRYDQKGMAPGLLNSLGMKEWGSKLLLCVFLGHSEFGMIYSGLSYS